MGKQTTVICDSCGKDITNTDKMPKYRIIVRSEPLPHVGDIVYAVPNINPIPKPLYFCSVDCMLDYFNNEFIN